MPYDHKRPATVTLPLLTVGDAFRLRPGLKIAMDIPNNRYVSNRPDDTTPTRAVQTLDPGNDLHTRVLAEEFVVYQTTYDGGGSDHGHDGAYPDGHHVWAEALNDPEITVDFYHGHSACSNEITLADLQPTRKYRRSWILL